MAPDPHPSASKPPTPATPPPESIPGRNRRGQKDWTANIPYELAREYNTMVSVRNKQRSGIDRRPKAKRNA